MNIRKLVITSFMAASLFVVQIAKAFALPFLPNVEFVSLLVLLYAVTFDRIQTLAAIYVFALLEGVIYGFGIWWFSYLYVWLILAAVAWLCRKNDSVILWAIIAGVFGLLFGALTAIPYLFAGGFFTAFSYWISGISFDLIHCVSNFLIVLLLFKPLHSFLKRLEHS